MFLCLSPHINSIARQIYTDFIPILAKLCDSNVYEAEYTAGELNRFEDYLEQIIKQIQT